MQIYIGFFIPTHTVGGSSLQKNIYYSEKWEICSLFTAVKYCVIELNHGLTSCQDERRTLRPIVVSMSEIVKGS